MAGTNPGTAAPQGGAATPPTGSAAPTGRAASTPTPGAAAAGTTAATQPGQPPPPQPDTTATNTTAPPQIDPDEAARQAEEAAAEEARRQEEEWQAEIAEAAAERRAKNLRNLGAVLAFLALLIMGSWAVVTGRITLPPWLGGDDGMASDEDGTDGGEQVVEVDPNAPPALVDVTDGLPYSLEGARADRVSHHFVGEDGQPIALAKVILADSRHTYCRLGGSPVAPVQCLNVAWDVDVWSEAAGPLVITVEEPAPEEDETVIAREGDVAATVDSDGTVTIATDPAPAAPTATTDAAPPSAAPAPTTGS